MQNQTFIESSAQQLKASNSIKVLRNTYALLSMTLLFSAITASATAALGIPGPGLVLTLVGYFGLLFLVNKTQNSAAGIASVFALTGFMGYTLGPIIGAYWEMAPEIVLNSLGGTALIFMGLSGYALLSKRDFNFLGGMLTVGILVAFIGGLSAIFFEIPALSLAVSAMFVLLMSGLILFETSRIINGGESNYISATVTLYVSIFNLFTSLLNLQTLLGGDE